MILCVEIYALGIECIHKYMLTSSDIEVGQLIGFHPLTFHLFGIEYVFCFLLLWFHVMKPTQAQLVVYFSLRQGFALSCFALLCVALFCLALLCLAMLCFELLCLHCVALHCLALLRLRCLALLCIALFCLAPVPLTSRGVHFEQLDFRARS